MKNKNNDKQLDGQVKKVLVGTQSSPADYKVKTVPAHRAHSTIPSIPVTRPATHRNPRNEKFDRFRPKTRNSK